MELWRILCMYPSCESTADHQLRRTPQIIELAGGAHPLNPSKDQSGAGKSFAIPPSRVLAQPTDILIICPCGLDIPTVERELDVLTTKARDKGEPNWWEVMREECKVAIVDGNQMFNRPGPRLVDALEWLTGLFNDVPEIIPRDFPYKLTGENAKDESAVLAREMKSLDAELAWLLTVDLPPTLANICTELTRCVKASASGAQDPNTKPGTLALSSVNNDSLKGYITINGSQIVKGELTIKLPNYNRGNPFKTNLVASKPYPLDQAQHAKNYTLLALKALESYTQPYSKQDAVEATDILLKYVNWARSALTHASVEKLFPYKVCDSSLFTPELPDDLVVEFFISDAFVVCSISALQYHASMPTTSAVAKLLGGPKPVNKVVKYKDKYVVIVDEIVIDSKSPTLVDMLAALKSVEDACRQFRTKLSLFL
ncbi:hypothetical protein BC938DRAFT_476512 [Jimgerdemannia flammicorona]|uniref:Uncharacterized protein n=1 Tax=Jimgerdemannia flammicorona TaxID=994334 RepID=A0A433QQC9_9FUNG|nr:hypothetical protein BC938DRAFT_476512 [Jimgerdemannia flammicorona]RUS32004.1 hypothetical protein BC938DRAFT_476512 [Jimgerdemannia flammicorona]